MALSITQTPALVSLSQSPIIFTVSENTPVYTSSSFQYIGELYYWTGSLTNSSSAANYTITKFPNTSNVGIFDLNRIINSTLTDYAQANTSNVVYYAVDFYWQYFNGSTYPTGSHVKSSTYKALDGYGIFQEAIGQNVTSSSVHWPLMTDGPTTQSAFNTNKGNQGVYVGTAGATLEPNKIVYVSNGGQTSEVALSSTTATSGQVSQYPAYPLQSGFPLSGSYTSYTIQAFNTATALGLPIKYDIVCNQKYPNVRIKWKNRYGQFDWLNFNLVSRQSFETERKSYSPQLGSWESSTLSYQNYDTGNQAYIADSKQGLSVNTNWLPESYNDILKQLLVSDEIYWIYDESTNLLRPLTITTQNIVFKTGVVDKLIQYQFDFQYGQPYKLIM
jgi:hypothetical protein